MSFTLNFSQTQAACFFVKFPRSASYTYCAVSKSLCNVVIYAAFRSLIVGIFRVTVYGLFNAVYFNLGFSALAVVLISYHGITALKKSGDKAQQDILAELLN